MSRGGATLTKVRRRSGLLSVNATGRALAVPAREVKNIHPYYLTVHWIEHKGRRHRAYDPGEVQALAARLGRPGVQR